MDNFYVNLISIGENKWRENIYNNIILTTKYYIKNSIDFTEEYITVNEWLNSENKNLFPKMNSVYYQACFDYDELIEPKFFPNEPVKINDTTDFRMVINYVITRNSSKLNQMVSTPWYDDEIIYSSAMWICIDKTVSNPTNYNLIICNDVELYKNEIDRVIEVCNKYGKEYKIISDKEISFNDVWNMFKVG